MIADFKTKEVYSFYIQLSLKDPWWLPRYEPHFGKSDVPLYGWLFFYFGRYTEGILYKTTEKDAKIADRHGNKYYLFPAEERKMSDEIRKAVKNRATFNVEETVQEDGTKHLTLVIYQ